MALDATVGGESADSYGTLAEGDAYAAARQWEDWSDADTEDVEAAMRQAAQRIDLLELEGWKATQAQSRRFPRTGLVDRDGYTVASDTIPPDVKAAQIELARELLPGPDGTADTDIQTALAGLESVKVGPVEVVNARPEASGTNTSDKSAMSFPIVARLMAPYATSVASGVRLVGV